jgi:hypothetical protein
MKAFIKAAADERMQRSVSLCLFQGGAFEDLLDWLLSTWFFGDRRMSRTMMPASSWAPCALRSSNSLCEGAKHLLIRRMRRHCRDNCRELGIIERQAEFSNQDIAVVIDPV